MHAFEEMSQSVDCYPSLYNSLYQDYKDQDQAMGCCQEEDKISVLPQYSHLE